MPQARERILSIYDKLFVLYGVCVVVVIFVNLFSSSPGDTIATLLLIIGAFGIVVRAAILKDMHEPYPYVMIAMSVLMSFYCLL